ncbi:MAG: AraC family transcriptional regulator [Victivallaceae bacterium]|nr:AraC family transcriptional regulator [Victivallaceae bacterium]
MLQKYKIDVYDRFLFAWSKSLLLDIEDFDLYLRVFAKMQSDGTFSNEFSSPGIIFHVVNSGTGIIEYEGSKVESGPGTMFIFWPDNKVKYYDSRNSPWDYTWFWLGGKSTQKILSLIGLTPDKRVYDISKCPGFLHTVDSVSECFENNEFSLFYPMTAAWMLVNALTNELSDKDNLVKINNIVEASMIFIENTQLSSVSVETLAEHFKINRSTIFRLFKNALDISPKEYIDKFRFEKACQLLSNKKLKIKEISDSCGYESQCYFSTAFQKRFAMTPSQWRQKQ